MGCRGGSGARPGSGPMPISRQFVSRIGRYRCSRADFETANHQRIAILSTSWQTVALMAPQDHDYRAFITHLHQRMEKAGSRAALIGGIGPKLYAAGIVLLAL